MLITHKLDEPCPSCGQVGHYGNVNVGDNLLNRGCRSCGKWFRYPLPELKKEIIYLDQFFLSHAFRKQERPFVEAVERIKELAARQLLVCPYSSVHTDETHLWRHEQQEELYEFIKQTARGHKFRQSYEIKQNQLIASFDVFRNQAPSAIEINERDAFHENIHKWDDYFWIDLRPILGDLEAMRQGKSAAIAALVGLFPDWAKLTTSFQEDVAEEARGYGRSLMEQYLKMVASVAEDFMNYLHSPIDASYVETLLHYDSNTMEIELRLQRVSEFLSSEYFANVPNVKVSCELFAVLRKMVKNGSYTNPENAKRKLAGLFYDSECISVFGPYCDAIFIDRAMKTWCDDPDAKGLSLYNTKTFSANDWDSFHAYLDLIEGNETEEITRSLKLVYPERYA